MLHVSDLPVARLPSLLGSTVLDSSSGRILRHRQGDRAAHPLRGRISIVETRALFWTRLQTPPIRCGVRGYGDGDSKGSEVVFLSAVSCQVRGGMGRSGSDEARRE